MFPEVKKIASVVIKIQKQKTNKPEQNEIVIDL